MIIVPLFVVFLLLDFCSSESPRMTCGFKKPFKTSENRCDNFTNVCVKQNDEDCTSFLGVCAQCPATNYSILMFYDIAKIKVELENTKLNMNKTAVEMKYTREKLINITNQLKNNEDRTNTMYILLSIIIFINIIMLILLPLEIKFRTITKLINRKLVKDYEKINNERLLSERNYEKINNERLLRERNFQNDLNDFRNAFDTRLNESLENIFQKKNFESKLNEILKIVQINLNLTKPKPKTKFRVNGQIIEIELDNKDNCVLAKRKIAPLINNFKSEDYKILKFKYKGKKMNDNDYLSSFNLAENDEIDCEKDLSININDILVLKTSGNILLPDFIQIHKEQTIFDLKRAILGISSIQDLKIFAKTKEIIDRKQLKILEDELTFSQCKVIDEEEIYFISKEVKELIISSIFDDRDSIVIQCVNFDTISALKNLVGRKLNCPIDDFVLIQKLSQKTKLVEEKYAFEYNFECESLKFCKVMPLDDIDFGEFLIKNTFTQLIKAKYRRKNMQILIKKYLKLAIKPKFEDNTYIMKELVTFQIAKSHPRFVTLYDVYKEPECFSVAMENMEGSLKLFVDNNDKANDKEIGKWSFQILEGLKFLHDNGIIHRDLNPSNILLDASKNIKLSSSNLSIYSDLRPPSSINMRIGNVQGIPIRYLAPEVIKGQIFNSKADVWSFGTTLIKIITKKKPFDNIVNKKDIIDKFRKDEISNYDCSNIQSVEFKRLVESCMKIDHNDRTTVESLLNDKFIKQFQN